MGLGAGSWRNRKHGNGPGALLLILVLLALPAMPGRVDAKRGSEHRFAFTIRTKWEPASLVDSANCGDLPHAEVLKELTKDGVARIARDPLLLSRELERQMLMRQITRDVCLTLWRNRDTLLLARTLGGSILGPLRDPTPFDLGEPLRLQGDWKALDYHATFDSLDAPPPHAAECRLMVRELETQIHASPTPHPLDETIVVDPVVADSLRREGWTIWGPVWTGAVAELHINPALIHSRLYIPSERRYARDCREGIRYALLAAMLPAERWARKEWGVARLPHALENDPWAFATFLVQRADEHQ